VGVKIPGLLGPQGQKSAAGQRLEIARGGLQAAAYPDAGHWIRWPARPAQVE